MPLLNTCLVDLGRSNSRIIQSICAVFLVLCIMATPSMNAQSSEADLLNSEMNNAGIDVMVVDLNCANSTDCQPYRPSHIVEYYGADWCEPCKPLELILDSIDEREVALIQHHPSITDQTYLNYSKHRFENQYRLLFIPSLVINDVGLLTGSGQGQELSQALASMTTNFSGIDDFAYSDGIIYWNTSTNHNLTVWKIEPTKHEFDNRTLDNLAVDMKIINNHQRSENLSMWITNSTTRLIIILQDDGLRQLQSLSSNPTGEMDLSEREPMLGDLLLHDGSYNLAIITFIALLIALLPALISFRKLQKQDEEESE